MLVLMTRCIFLLSDSNKYEHSLFGVFTKTPEKRRKGFDYFLFDNSTMNVPNGEPELKMNYCLSQ